MDLRRYYPVFLLIAGIVLIQLAMSVSGTTFALWIVSSSLSIRTRTSMGYLSSPSSSAL